MKEWKFVYVDSSIKKYSRWFIKKCYEYLISWINYIILLSSFKYDKPDIRLCNSLSYLYKVNYYLYLYYLYLYWTRIMINLTLNSLNIFKKVISQIPFSLI